MADLYSTVFAAHNTYLVRHFKGPGFSQRLPCNVMNKRDSSLRNNMVVRQANIQSCCIYNVPAMYLDPNAYRRKVNYKISAYITCITVNGMFAYTYTRLRRAMLGWRCRVQLIKYIHEMQLGYYNIDKL